MKKRKTNSAYTAFSLLFILAILSFSSNPPNGNTGAPGEGTCASCHSNPSPGVNGLVTVEGLPATTMVNTTYSLSLRAETTMGSAATGGFQLVALDDNDLNIGDLIPTAGDVGTNTSGNGREYIEHRGDKAFSGAEVTWNFDWTAPSTSGTVNMYAVANLSNNQSNTGGDLIVLTSISSMISGGSTPPTVTVSTTDVDCNGASTGTATANVVDGTPPFTYFWSNGASGNPITNLPAGNYSVTVTDANSLTATSSGSVGQGSAIQVLLFPTDVSCFGNCDGVISSQVSGGAGNYSYLWNDPLNSTDPTIQNLCPGNYTLTVTDGLGCTATATESINQPNQIMIMASSLSPSCSNTCDGTATAIATGGVGTFDYLWNDANSQTTQTATGLCAGTYMVTVSDANGCFNTAMVVVVGPEELIATSTATEVLCNGDCNGSATITVTGGTPDYTYFWPDGQAGATAINLCAGTYTPTITDANGCSTTTTVTVLEPAAITLSGIVTPVNCNGECTGSIDLTVGQGTGIFTYLWSDNNLIQDRTDLCAGQYSVTVTDQNGCSEVESFTITEPTSIDPTVAITSVTCNGDCDGTITLSNIGGTPPHTFLWTFPNGQVSTTQNLVDLCPGTYNLTITDNNACTETIEAIVTEPTPVFASSVVIPPACNGDCGSILLNPSGGTSPYTVAWNTGATTLSIDVCAPGNYTVTVSDANGCTFVLTVPFTEPAPIAISATTTDVLCNGDCNGTVDITVTGGISPFSFLWSNASTTEDQNDLCTGTYSVTATDANNCTTTLTVAIEEPNALEGQVSATSAFCFGECNGTATVSVSGGTSIYTYQWDANTGGQVTSTAVNLCAGTYLVTVTDFNDCSETFMVTVDHPSPISVNATATGETQAGGNDGTATANPSGGTPGYTYLWNTGATSASINNLAPGTYTVTVTDANGCIEDATVTVNSFDCPITVILVETDPLCDGEMNGSITASADNGTAPYTYSWSTGDSGTTIMGLAAGTYSVTATDANNCSITAMIELTAPAPVSVNPTVTNANCPGSCDGTIALNATGGTGALAYTWIPALPPTPFQQNLCAGQYIVIINDDNGCQRSDTFNIAQPNSLAVTWNANTPTCGLCNGFIDLEVAGGTAPYSYTWNNGLPPAQDQTGLCPGDYMVTVTDANNCTASINTITLTQADPIEIVVSSVNPVTCNGECNGSIDISVTGGNPPYTFDWTSGGTTEDLSDLCAGDYIVTVTDADNCQAIITATVTQPPLLTATINTTNETSPGANDGTATATPAGGTPGYTYLWNTNETTSSISNLPPGVYTVTIADANGCEVVLDGTVSSGTCPLVVTISTLDAFCNGGSTGTAIATAVNGTPPYTYQWSSGGNSNPETGLMAGIYTLTVTDATSCSDIISFTIGEPAPLSATITPINGVNCNGGMDGVASVTPGGGTGPYTFIWSNGGTNSTQNNLAANGTVRVTDANGCIDTFSYTLPEPSALMVAMSSTPETTLGAMDGTATASPSGGIPPYTYLWNNAGTTPTISGLAPGNYSVTVTDSNNCTLVGNTVVNAGGCDLVLESLTTVDILCADGTLGSATIIVTGGTLPYTYIWSSGGNMATETGLAAGTYSVSVVDAMDCVVSSPFSISEAPALDLVVTNQTTVQCGGDMTAMATVMASGGTPPYVYAWPGGGSAATETGLTNITYTVSVTDANMCLSTVMLSIESFDTEAPVINPLPADLSIYLDNQGDATLAIGDLNSSSTDNCGNLTEAISQADFNCDDVGESTIIYLATDNSGNSSTASFVLTVLDTLVPTVIAQDLTIYLDQNGLANINASDVDGGSSDNCGIDSLVLDRMEFDCGSIGANTVYLVGFDPNGNCTVDSAIITVLDTIAPVIVCPTDITITDCTGFLEFDIDFSDNCLVAAPVLLNGLPSGSIFPEGPTTNTYSLSDQSGNEVTCSFTITYVEAPLEGMINIMATPCPGEANGVLMASTMNGTPPYEYFWDDPMQQNTATASGLSPGMYSVSITDSRACDTLVLMISLPESPAVQITVDQVTDASNGMPNGAIDVSITGGLAPYSFLWTTGGVMVATTEDISGIPAGIYILEVTDNNNCVFRSDTIVVDDLTATQNLLDQQNIRLAPNPNNGQFTLYFDGLATGQEWRMELMDLQGRLVWSKGQEQINRQVDLDMATLAEGLYLLRLEGKSGVAIRKVIIAKP